MFIPKCWVREKRIVTYRGRDIELSCWGWSNESEEDARAMAQRRLAELEGKARSNEKLERYAYGTKGPLREEIIHYLDDNEQSGCIITRNRYGALVMNTKHVMFGDIDIRPVTVRWGPFKIFRKTEYMEEQWDEVYEQVRKWVDEHANVAVRIYRTYAGVRILFISNTYDPIREDTLNVLTELSCDPLYIRLCQTQGSFRARLTPKPWRIGMDRCRVAWPPETEKLRKAYSRWVLEYTKKCEPYATCRYIDTYGSSYPLPEISSIIEYHDKVTKAQSSLPLA